MICLGLLVQAFSSPKKEKLEDGIYAEINTAKGSILIKLEHEYTPMTVANFVGLAEGSIDNDKREKGTPYYDGLNFHRVIADFMIQGGCPMGNGMGSPGYKFRDEFHDSLKHDRAGTLSMANSGPHTNGSQFFITHGPTPHLDGKHSVFGYVVKGQDVVDSVRNGDTIQGISIIRQGKDLQDFMTGENTFETYKQMAAEKENSKFTDLIKEKYPEAKKTESGLHYIIEAEGEGDSPKPGDLVKVHYKGFFPDGRVFDESYKRGTPLPFTLGKGQVIKGWDEGIGLMKKGAKYKLIIPSELGYGDRGIGPIPPGAILIFDTELISIN